MGLRPIQRDDNPRCRHPRVSGGPHQPTGRWIPSSAGMTGVGWLSTESPWAFGRPGEMKILLVTPAQAGVHGPDEVDSRFRGNDVVGVIIRRGEVRLKWKMKDLDEIS